MVCVKCGKEVNDGQKYCSECEAYENSSKVKGILSLALAGASIVGILPLIGAIAGIIFGVMSKGTKGEKLGQAGMIVGIIGIAVAAVEYIASAILMVAFIVIMLLYFVAIMSAAGGMYY